jgi:hypothetical protein
MQMHALRPPVIADRIGGKGMQMRLVAGADLQGGGIDLGEPLVRQPATDRRLNAIARQQKRAPVSMYFAIPPWAVGHWRGFRLEIPVQMR